MMASPDKLIKRATNIAFRNGQILDRDGLDYEDAASEIYSEFEPLINTGDRPFITAPEFNRLIYDALDRGKKAPRKPSFTASELWDMVFPPVSFVVQDIIAGGLTIVAGAPKLGKSWLVLQIASAIETGGYTLGDRKCQQGSVLYAALEDTPRRLKDRLRATRTIRPGDDLTFWTEMPTLDNGGLEKLQDWIDSAENPRLIIIDVLNKVREPQGRNEAPYAYDYRSVTPLKDLADETGVAIVVVHHVRKMGSDDSLERVSGTNGLTGAADTIITLSRDGSGVTLYGRGRDIPEFEMAVEFDKGACRWSVLGDAQEVRRSDERSAILDALASEVAPIGPSVIASVTGQAAGNVRVLLAKMARAGEVRLFGYGKYHLPTYTPDNTGNSDNTSEVA